ncbi:MAG: long-chain-fatty-acid--CoA ligase [Acidobacteria bacterium]|nr:long-chain-fatty-acid--CoA ligase [Acidobacteriota bacterium]
MFLPLTPIRFLLWAADEYGEKVGVVDGDKRFTYKQVLDRALRLRKALRSLGVDEGDRVATLSFNCHPLLEAYYGVPMAKAILLSLNVRLAPEEQAHILEHSGSKVVLFDPEFLPLVEQLRASLPGLRWVSLERVPDLPLWVHTESYEDLLAAATPEPVDFTTYDENAIAELFYTSGSTGPPKGVMLSHRTLHLHALTALVGIYRRGEKRPADQQVELHTIPLFHANGWGKAHTVTLTGGRHVMVKRFEPDKVLELIEREKATSLCAVPTMATALVNCPNLSRYDISSLEEIMLGGAASSPSLVAELEEQLKCRVYAGYGLTETSPVAMIAHVKSTLGEISEQERIRRQAMTGFCFPGVEARVVGADGNDVPQDMQSTGEILFRGDIVMDGYWNEPEATAETVRDNWLHTGDVAVWDKQNYLLIVDRQKDIIISGGENISSIEIEKVIVAHPAVYETAVVAVPDEKWGEVPKAFVVLKPGSTTTEDDIRDHVREHLAGFKVPKLIEFKDELPKGATGKILKRALRDPHWGDMEKHVHGSGRG